MELNNYPALFFGSNLLWLIIVLCLVTKMEYYKTKIALLEVWKNYVK